METIITDKKKIKDLFGRYVQAIYPSAELAEKIFSSGRKLRFYFGIDPTGPHIHIGNATNLLWLKRFQALGHEAILLIGDFTARIGDPTDKTATRKTLTEEEVSINMKHYLDQVHKVLAKGSFEVKYNSQWFAGMDFKQIIDLASRVTVQQMIARDMFQERLKNQKPVYVHEFFYPLMQGYDSVALQVDGELCGNDQTFNSLMGRDLEKEILGKEKLVITTKLLENPITGRKIMNKSEGNIIALDDEPQEIRRKVLNGIGDKMIKTVFELCTEKDQSWIDGRQEAVNGGENPKIFKEELADELVRIYHGSKDVEKTKQPQAKVSAGNVLAALKKSGLVKSASEAKKLIVQGAVDVNGQTVREWGHILKKGDEVRVGKGNFISID